MSRTANENRNRYVCAIGLIIFTFLMACSCPVTIVHAQDAARKKIAFVVGVEKYEKEGLKDLDWSENDARALQKALVKQGFTVTLLVGSGNGNNRASYDNLKVQWPKFVVSTKALNKQDIVMVAVSGHGVQMPVPDPQSGRIVDDEFFCPVDGLKNDPKTLWSLSAVMDDLGTHSGSSNNLLLMDACRFSSGKGDKGLDGSSASIKAKCSFLLACEGGKKAFEYEDLKHGLFTYFVLEALNGRANRSGVVTWDDLTTYVKSQVIRESKVRNQPQIPSKVEYSRGESPVLAEKVGAEAIDGSDYNEQTDPRAHGAQPFENVTFTGTFSGTDFRRAKFVECRFERVKFINSVNVYGAEMVDCQLINCNFRGANTGTLTLRRTDSGGADYANGEEPREL